MGYRKIQRSKAATGPPRRADRIVNNVVSLDYMSTSLVAEFNYDGGNDESNDSESTARRRARRDLGKLTSDGALKKFAIPNSTGIGAPEKVYCQPSTKIPQNLAVMPHLLEINRLALTLRAACLDNGYSFDFKREYDPLRKHQRGDLRPDLVFSIRTERAGAFYFAELCRRTEPLHASDKSRATVCRKIAWYVSMVGEEWKRFAEPFGHFRGFRMLWVVTHNIDGILRVCDEIGTGDVVGVAEVKDITPKTVIDEKIWVVPGLSMERKFKLKWCPEDLENKK